MDRFQILFATDGRPSSVAAAALLERLADPSRVEVTILSLPDPRTTTPERYVEDLLEATEQAMTHVGLPSRSIFRDEDPATGIEKESAGGEYGMVALGAGNHIWDGETVLGGVTNHVLRQVPIPILVVHRHRSALQRRLRVLVGADGSPAAAHAMDTLARITDPDRVDIFLRAVTPMPEIVFSSGHGGVCISCPQFPQASGADTSLTPEQLEDALARLRSEGFRPEGSLGTGWPATDLMDQAKRGQVDLVVVGSRGIGTLERGSLGSVSAHVTRHAPAVLVAHPEEKKGLRAIRSDPPDEGLSAWPGVPLEDGM